MVTLFASRADAQRVEWMPGDTPEECISAGLLRTRILRAATDPIAQDLLLRLGVHHVGEEYQVALEVLFEEQVLTRRELVVHALRCQELDDTLVLVSVLMLDAATLRRQQAAPALDPRRWQLGLSAGVMVRVLPSTQPDAGVDVRWMNARFALHLRGFMSGEAHATAAEGSFDLRAVGLDVQGCYRSRPFGTFTLGPCVTASFGQLRGLATGLSLEDRVQRNVHVRTGVGLSASVDVGPWVSVVPSLGFDLALTRTSYRYSQTSVTREAYGVPLLGVRAQLALLVRINPRE